MDNTFENRILAYLDGLLDARSEAAFLKEVSLDAEKQKLLRQYRQLHQRLHDRSRPLAVPLRTQQALANHIPVLKEVVPGTVLPPAGSAADSGRLPGATRRTVSLIALSGLLIVTLSVLSLGPDDTGTHTEYTEMGHGKKAHPSGHIVGGRSEDAASDPADQRTAAEAVHDRAGGSALGQPALTTDMTHRGEEQQFSGARKDDLGSPFANADKPAIPVSHEEDIFAGSGVLDTGLQPLVYLARPGREISSEYRRDVFPSQSPLDLFSGRLHFCLETGAAQFGANGSTSDHSGFTGVYLAALRYDVTRAITAGLEIGQSRFARQRLENRRSALNASGQGEIIVIDRALVSEFQSWLRAHGVYSFQPENRFRFEADAGAGLLLNTDKALFFSCGLSAVYALSTSLQARAGLHYSGTWLSPAPAEPLVITPGDGVIGVIRNADSAENVFSSAVELRIGFGVLLW